MMDSISNLQFLKDLGNNLAGDVNPRHIGIQINNNVIKLASYETSQGKTQMLSKGYKKMSYKDLTLLCRIKIEEALKQDGSTPKSLTYTHTLTTTNVQINPITQIATSLAGFREREIEKRDSFLGTCQRIFLRALQFLSFAGVITIPIGLAIGKKIQDNDPEQNENSKYIFDKYQEVQAP